MTVKDMEPERLKQVRDFLDAHKFSGAELLPLAGDASFRRYIRVRKPGAHAMLMDAPPQKENSAPYLAVASYLYAQGYSVPAILAHDLKAGLLLLEDLGNDLFTLELQKQNGVSEQALYEAAIDVLAQWHGRPPLANPRALPLPLYDHALLMQEAKLFSDWYLPQIMGKEAAAGAGAEYLRLWEVILKNIPLATDSFVHRDYHADNLMWLPAREGVRRVGLLDFQDAVYGDAAYDVVSLLEDARRDVPPELAQAMLDRYLSAAGADRRRFMTAYAILGAQRNSKIVGIFVRLAARDNKYAYLNYLPRVWRHLENDLAHPALAELKAWMDKHVSAQWRGAVAIRHNSHDLARIA